MRTSNVLRIYDGALANAVRALSKSFDREDLKPGDQCVVLSQQVRDLKCQNYKPRKKLIATEPWV